MSCRIGSFRFSFSACLGRDVSTAKKKAVEPAKTPNAEDDVLEERPIVAEHLKSFPFRARPTSRAESHGGEPEKNDDLEDLRQEHESTRSCSQNNGPGTRNSHHAYNGDR